jgi:hypothetical protein
MIYRLKSETFTIFLSLQGNQMKYTPKLLQESGRGVFWTHIMENTEDIYLIQIPRSRLKWIVYGQHRAASSFYVLVYGAASVPRVCLDLIRRHFNDIECHLKPAAPALTSWVVCFPSCDVFQPTSSAVHDHEACKLHT